MRNTSSERSLLFVSFTGDAWTDPTSSFEIRLQTSGVTLADLRSLHPQRITKRDVTRQMMSKLRMRELSLTSSRKQHPALSVSPNGHYVASPFDGC
jgi:hypothetical protein